MFDLLIVFLHNLLIMRFKNIFCTSFKVKTLNYIQSYPQVVFSKKRFCLMDYNEGKKIWENILSIYSEDMDFEWYNFMFQNTKYRGTDDSFIYLSCPNDFIRNSIVTKDIENINSIISDKLDMNVGVKILIDGEDIPSSISPTSKKASDKVMSFQNDYTFANFVQGSSNRLAYAASLSVADSPAMESSIAYNPLFIYGGVGLGKTHLMHAIANKIYSKNPNYKIEYLTSETFTNHLIESIRENKNEEFRSKYRSLDVILIDDIQFLSGKEGTQEEFFHTFNSLKTLNKQIVISSDKPPKEIATLEDRLRTRFEQGLIVDIQPPDFETRVAILKNKAVALKKQYSVKDDSLVPKNLDIPEEAYKFIAKNIKSNIRELEGALIKVYAYASLMNIDITYDMIVQCLKDIIQLDENVEINPEYIIQVVASHSKIKVEDIIGKKRKQHIANARQIAMYLCRKLTDLSLPKIGEQFNRDHSTVLHACNKISEEMENNIQFNKKMENLINKIKGF